MIKYNQDKDNAQNTGGKKMLEFRILKNRKTAKLTSAIIETEELELEVSYKVDALGDSVIVIRGVAEEVKTFKEIYKMVA